MSWIENANKDLTITTGDGKKYVPNTLNAKRSTDFNVAQFNFVGVKGTLVKRSEIMGAVYDIELYFQGADYLDVVKSFKVSSENKKAWTIQHPQYDAIYVQPLGLGYDDSSWNVTKVTGQVMETLSSNIVRTYISPIDIIQAKKLSTDATFAQSFVTDIPIPDIADVSTMKAKVSTLERLQAAYATTQDEAQAAYNTYNQANAAIDNAFADCFKAIQTTQALISLPAVFESAVLSRIAFLIKQSVNLYASVTGITLPHLKKIYENFIGAVISSICSASVTNVSSADYVTRNDVVQVITLLTDTYNNYISNLDYLQTANGGSPDSYVPNFDNLNDLSTLVTYTISNLFEIASGAKQQRTVTLSSDSNWINIAFEIYGLLPDDSTITKIMNENNAGLSEVLQVKKGRLITYYI